MVRTQISLTRRSRSMLARVIAVALPLVALSPLTADAQISINMDALRDAFANSFKDMVQTKVLVTPIRVRIDATARTATLTFTNPTADTMRAEVRVGVAPPADIFGAPAKSDSAPKKSPLLDAAQESSSSAPDQGDTIKADQSMASWIKDLPSTVTLAPREKRKVTVTLNVPAGTKPGEYAAWIVTTTKVKMKSMEGREIGINGGSGKVGKMTQEEKDKLPESVNESGAKIVYRHEASQ